MCFVFSAYLRFGLSHLDKTQGLFVALEFGPFIDPAGHEVEEVNRYCEQYEEERKNMDSDPMDVQEEDIPDTDIELGLSNQDLVQISTKDLNELLKKKGIGKDRAMHIKQERRTLRNKAFAAMPRVKREMEEDAIRKEIDRMLTKLINDATLAAQAGFTGSASDYMRLAMPVRDPDNGDAISGSGTKLKCPFCERVYGYETNLRAHIRQRHQGAENIPSWVKVENLEEFNRFSSLSGTSPVNDIEGSLGIRSRNRKAENIPWWVKVENHEEFNRFCEQYCSNEEERKNLVELRRKMKNRDDAQRSRQKRIENTDKLKTEHDALNKLLEDTNQELVKLKEEIRRISKESKHKAEELEERRSRLTLFKARKVQPREYGTDENGGVCCFPFLRIWLKKILKSLSVQKHSTLLENQW